MSMQAESLAVLDEAAVPPVQARAIVRAIEIEIAGAKDTLATKHDAVLLRQEVAAAETRLHAEMTKAEARLAQQITQSGSVLRVEMHASASSALRQMYVALLGQMAVLLGISYFFMTQIAR